MPTVHFSTTNHVQQQSLSENPRALNPKPLKDMTSRIAKVVSGIFIAGAVITGIAAFSGFVQCVNVSLVYGFSHPEAALMAQRSLAFLMTSLAFFFVYNGTN